MFEREAIDPAADSGGAAFVITLPKMVYAQAHGGAPSWPKHLQRSTPEQVPVPHVHDPPQPFETKPQDRSVHAPAHETGMQQVP
jgi:hypothetical protein